MSKELNGEKLAAGIKADIKSTLASLGQRPNLTTILVGDDSASRKYVEMKEKDCEEVGIGFEIHRLSSEVSKKEIIDEIEELNDNEKYDGILVQLPLPNHLNEFRILKSIKPSKDVDGLSPFNVGKLWSDGYSFEEDLLPCTPKGIMKLLDYYSIDLTGKEITIINRSNLVGKPLAKLMLDRNGTVSICHSRTNNIEDYTLSADILVSAVGRRPDFVITKDMIKEGSTVIDVGMNYLEGGLCGDVEFGEVKQKASFITPVPGGVGPMTRAMLLENIMLASGVKYD